MSSTVSYLTSLACLRPQSLQDLEFHIGRGDSREFGQKGVVSNDLCSACVCRIARANSSRLLEL